MTQDLDTVAAWSTEIFGPDAQQWERLLDATSGLSEFERDALFANTAAAVYRIDFPGRTS